MEEGKIICESCFANSPQRGRCNALIQEAREEAIVYGYCHFFKTPEKYREDRRTAEKTEPRRGGSFWRR